MSWRISSSDSGSFLVMMRILASCSMGRNRSHSLPSTMMISAALARPGPMAAAISAPVTPRAKVMALPSGKVMVTCSGAADTGILLELAGNCGGPLASGAASSSPAGRGACRVMTHVVELQADPERQHTKTSARGVAWRYVMKNIVTALALGRPGLICAAAGLSRQHLPRHPRNRFQPVQGRQDHGVQDAGRHHLGEPSAGQLPGPEIHRLCLAAAFRRHQGLREPAAPSGCCNPDRSARWASSIRPPWKTAGAN